MADPTITERARAALARHDWREAFETLAAADSRDELTPEELGLLADAAWWVGRLPVAIEARERAYARLVKADRPVDAAIAAVNLGRDNLLRNAVAEATGWLNRAERLVQGREESQLDGWLAATRAFEASLSGDVERSLSHARSAYDIAARFGDRNLEAYALSEQAAGLLAKGEVAAGLALADEATVAAVSGELEPSVAGGVCCATIEVCATMGDWRRAAEWTEAQDRWCAREGISGYPGMCRLYRAEIKRHRGAWLEAETEARRATDELQGYIPAAVGSAFYVIGLIRLRRGDLPAARAALQMAHTYQRDPEPAMSLLLLAEGNAEAANASIRRALDEPSSLPSWSAPPDTDLHRVTLLPAQVEIALAAGDLDRARAAAEELARQAERFGTTAIRASAAWALGGVRLAEGDGGASSSLREAMLLWTEADEPYERARSQLLLAQAYAAAGESDRAVLEGRAARAALERLGALGDLRRADEVLRGLQGAGGTAAPAAKDATVRTFVFTDIVDSTRLAELLGDEAWENLIRWHDRTIRTLVAEFGGEEVKATGDGFFLAFADPDRAIDCAIALQRRLAEQRQAEGFAPAVRIGIHRSKATRAGLDYRGTGVNQAARIGSQAAGAEILVSAETLVASRRTHGEVHRSTVELKGFSRPVDVVAVDWR